MSPRIAYSDDAAFEDSFENDNFEVRWTNGQAEWLSALEWLRLRSSSYRLEFDALFNPIKLTVTALEMASLKVESSIRSAIACHSIDNVNESVGARGYLTRFDRQGNIADCISFYTGKILRISRSGDGNGATPAPLVIEFEIRKLEE